jgi:hypothetical protein
MKEGPSMPVDVRPAMPGALPSMTTRRWDRFVRAAATAAAALAATVAVVVVAMSAVMLGLT